MLASVFGLKHHRFCDVELTTARRDAGSIVQEAALPVLRAERRTRQTGPNVERFRRGVDGAKTGTVRRILSAKFRLARTAATDYGEGHQHAQT